MSISPSLTALGSLNLDMIVQTDRLPTAGETLTGGRFTSLPGGKGANVALAAQRLGARVTFIAAHGDDDYARQALHYLNKSGVDLSGLIALPHEHTGVAFINVADDGENQIAVASGANAALKAEDLPPLKSDALITQFEIPLTTIAAAIKDFEGFVSLNASPVMDVPPAIFTRADLIIVNEGEYTAYQNALEGFQGYLAITLGAHGARLVKHGHIIAQAVPPSVNVIDTTGAGDSFAAALTLALLEKQSPQDAINFACAVGALTATRLGTQSAAPMRSDVTDLLETMA